MRAAPARESWLKRLGEGDGKTVLELAGLIVAVIGVVLAIVAYLNPRGTPQANPSPSASTSIQVPTPSSATTSPSTPPPTTSAPPPTPSASPDRKLDPTKGIFDCDALESGTPKVRNCAESFTMSSESITDAIDLDNKYSDWGTKNGDYANFYYSDSELLTYESDTGDQHEFISRAPRGAPSYSTCADPIARDYKYFMDMKNAEKNIMFCVKTPKGRYAAVRLLKDWESAEKIQVAIVTWEKH